jgi:deazaflavin-dependent oxidoreductase (nitroreductase family)
MSATTSTAKHAHTRPSPRFGGVLWRLARLTTPVLRPLAGHLWNPIFAILEHRGRRSGRAYSTPVAARRVDHGFVIALAFGSQVDWYRNLVAADGGTIRWRGRDYPVGAPRTLDPADGIAAFMAVQRAALRLGRIDAYIRVDDR